MTNATLFANELDCALARKSDSRTVFGRASEHVFFGVSVLLFAASAAITIA